MYEDRNARLGKLPSDRRYRLRQFYDRADLRANGSWQGKGYSGDEYREPSHLYQDDLNILGAGSLFEYLATARTEAGRLRLASFLLHPTTADEARARQAAVQELRDLPELREQVALLGTTGFSDCDSEALMRFLDAPPAGFPRWLPPISLAASIVLVALVVVALLALVPWAAIVPVALPLLALNGLAGLLLMEPVKSLLTTAEDLQPELAILTQGVHLLASQEFQSAKLRALVERARAMPPGLRRLARLAGWIRERNRDWFYAISLYLCLGTQLAMLFERLRIRDRASLRDAIDIWSEFEALEAVGTYAFEHPGDVYPEFCEDTAYRAEGLGHPLLDEEACVRNDVCFDSACRFWIISGSNMAGKSTILRSIGASIVLALAGAPVRAARLTLAPLSVCASIGVPDSLLDGKSRFQSEVDRIRDSIAAASRAPALFLIDEIFAGTNSQDRRIAAEAVVRTLLDHGAIGALSTHDLALTEIAALGAGTNVHMCSRGEHEPLDFDYLVKPGVNRQTNALAIARLAGVPV